MIRVLHVVGKMGLGGAESRLVDLARFADKSKFYFDFCVFADGDYDDQVRKFGCGIVKCRLTRNIFSFSRQFRELLKKGRYDAIHCHIHQFSGVPLRIAAKEGIAKRIMHLRTTKGFHHNNLYRICYNGLMSSWIKKYATRIAAVSESAAEAYLGANWRQDKRAEVIYNGIDVELFGNCSDRVSVLAEFGIPGDSKVVVHVGNFRPAKDHKTLIESAATVVAKEKNVHFLLVGSGDLMEQSRKLAIEKGLEGQIHFAGSRRDVPRLLLASDCFVFTSRWEGLPGAVLEAIAAGLAVVASDIGPVREIASQSDQVHLVSVGNAAEFAQKTTTILTNLDNYKSSPGQIPERFGFENYVQKMLSLYE